MKKQEKGIWKFKDLLPPIEKKYHRSLGEGGTKLLKAENIFFKCEFENPTGSVKDRSIAYQISKLLEKNIKKAVISSSGNAAISAATYCRLAEIDLAVFISPEINKNKLAQLETLFCRIVKTSKPISSAFQYAKNNNAFNLRQSKDINAAFGCETIAYELNLQEPKIDALFIPASSGTTLVGIVSGYEKLGKLPAIHAVQTEAIHPIACLFDNAYKNKKKTLADAIVARFTSRQEEIVDMIKENKGWAWTISDKEMKEARKWLLNRKINCSYEGAATLAALWKARASGYKYKYPVCLLTGRYY